MTVSMDKNYALRDQMFTVLTTTKKGNYPVLGHDLDGQAYEFDANGAFPYSSSHLVEVSPYFGFKVDDPVMVRNYDCDIWLTRFFAGVSETGKPKVWNNGTTQWSSGGQTANWNSCRQPTAEEWLK